MAVRMHRLDRRERCGPFTWRVSRAGVGSFMKTSTLSSNYIHRSSRPSALLCISLLIGCFAVLPATHAVDPPPDGGYPRGNTAEGEDALLNLTTGRSNTAVGHNALFSDTTGSFNTAVGGGALSNSTTGDANTAVGNTALGLNTTGHHNTATGSGALDTNFTGNYNTASGGAALLSNTSGSSNTANGFAALQANDEGNENTATGFFALSSNTSGSQNTANGVNALYSNIGGVGNTATGESALYSSFGNFNTADGWLALQNNTSGSNNTACGVGALLGNTTGANNVALGANAGRNLTTGSNNVDIGNEGVGGEWDTIRIGTQGTQTKTFVAGISGAAIGGMEVRVNQNGQLGTAPSSERFKELIKPMGNASEALLALRPVTFRYKPDVEPESTQQFGLIAEEVQKVNPELVVRDRKGKPYSVRYDQVNAMLLNEFLKEHRKVDEQGATIAKQQNQIEALTAGLQKVSAQLAADREQFGA
ncbi:MAG: hypothetical protein DME65_04810 [Verrucomicrobia bacterium]|nr:MAG: hypothetical protein DME65_04810 [Verrucomicrobiota bacterium]